MNVQCTIYININMRRRIESQSTFEPFDCSNVCLEKQKQQINDRIFEVKRRNNKKHRRKSSSSYSRVDFLKEHIDATLCCCVAVR